MKGHNSANYGGITGEHLRQYVERIERLEEDKKVVSQDIKEVFGEAKANGFDAKIMRKIIAVRKLDAADRKEQEALTDLYMQALGMIPPPPPTPIEEAINKKIIQEENAAERNRSFSAWRWACAVYSPITK